MIVVMLKGGLGNQMFQYAFGKYLALKYNLPLYLNQTIYLEERSNRTFDLEIFKITSYSKGHESEIKRPKSDEDIIFLNELHFHYDSHLSSKLDTLSNPDLKLIVLNGFWQSYKYFLPIDKVIRSEFSLKKKLTGKWEDIRIQIKSQNSVMINVRRTDYLTKLEYHGVVSEEYIAKAIKHCLSKISDPKFYIFSDDMNWCRQTLLHYKDLFFVDESYYDFKYQFYFQLMSECKHYILANSSFCWWAAWLGQTNNSVVIYPKKWFTAQHLDTKDLSPEAWLAF